MKRLLEETPDELEQSLLRVGSDAQPDGLGKARLLSAVATGTLGALATTQLSSVAWWRALLATKAGKVAVVGVLAGGTVTASWLAQTNTLSSVRSPGADSSRVEPPVAVPTPGPSALPPRQAQESRGLAKSDPPAAGVMVDHDEASGAEPSLGSIPSIPDSNSRLRTGVNRQPLDANSERTLRTTGVSHADTREATQVTKRRVEAVGDSAGVTAIPAPAASPATTSEAAASQLLLEARLVDQLRNAIRKRDVVAAQQLIERYRREFPNGQMGPEVIKLESQRAALNR